MTGITLRTSLTCLDPTGLTRQIKTDYIHWLGRGSSSGGWHVQWGSGGANSGGGCGSGDGNVAKPSFSSFSLSLNLTFWWVSSSNILGSSVCSYGGGFTHRKENRTSCHRQKKDFPRRQTMIEKENIGREMIKCG